MTRAKRERYSKRGQRRTLCCSAAPALPTMHRASRTYSTAANSHRLQGTLVEETLARGLRKMFSPKMFFSPNATFLEFLVKQKGRKGGRGGAGATRIATPTVGNVQPVQPPPPSLYLFEVDCFGVELCICSSMGHGDVDMMYPVSFETPGRRGKTLPNQTTRHRGHISNTLLGVL